MSPLSCSATDTSALPGKFWRAFERMGLVRVETVAPGTLLGSRTVRLWSLTTAGRKGSRRAW